MMSVEVRHSASVLDSRCTSARTLKASHTMMSNSATVAAGGHASDVPAFRIFRTLTRPSTVLRMAFFRFPDEGPEVSASDIVDCCVCGEVIVQGRAVSD